MEPSNESNFYKRFRVYLRQQKLREALADLTSALKVKPDYESALVQRAKLQLKMGKCYEASQDFQNLRARNPNHKDLSMADNADTCKQALKEADKRIELKRYKEARDYLNVAGKFAESSVNLFVLRALCNINLGDFYETVADAGRALKLDGGNLEALDLRGKGYYVLGEFDMAMNHFRQGLQYDPEHVDIKESYRTIKKIQTHETKATKAQGKRDWEGAVKHWLAMIAVDPEHPVYIFKAAVELAKAYKELKQYENGKIALEDILRRDENHAPALHQLGLILLDMELFEEAVQKCKRAAEIDNGNGAYQDGLKRAEAALKQSKQKDYYKILGKYMSFILFMII